MKYIKLYKNYLKVIGIFCVGIAGYVYGNIQGYQLGYGHGKEDCTNSWHKKLLDEDFAEYDVKTGQWKLRRIEDVVSSGLVLGVNVRRK